MSIRQGKKLIASSTTNGFNLFDCKWADHILNNISWLRADTFSWQSGDVYVAAYEHLVADYESATTGYSWTGDITGIIYVTKGMPSVGDTVVGGGYTVGEVSSLGITVYKNGSPYETATLKSAVSGINTSQTDTIGDITITYYLAEDGHKICLPDQESNLVALYEATGVAWYYILDTTNRQFKLPRTKFGFTGIRSGVGGYVTPGLPNITGQSNVWGSNSESGALKTTITSTFGFGSKVYSVVGNIGLDASKSNAIYGNSTTVQPPATQMYLYFYVGNFTQSAIEQTAGLNAEMFNDLNAHKVIAFQAPTSANGYTWYRKYADGWVEQGGIKLQNTDSKQALSLPIEMNGSTYSVLTSVMDDNLSNYVFCVKVTDKTTTGFKTTVWGSYQQGVSTSNYNFVWQVSGMSA